MFNLTPPKVPAGLGHLTDARIEGPVGVRMGTANTRNRTADQLTVIGLIGRISTAQGGKREIWAQFTPGIGSALAMPRLGGGSTKFRLDQVLAGIFPGVASNERPTPGVDGYCPPEVEAIVWQFQMHWQARGVFRRIDGVVDPGGNTLRKLNELTRVTFNGR